MRRRGASSSLGRSWTRRSFGWLAGGRPCPGEHVRRLRRRGPCAHAAARKGWPVFTGAATALLLRGAAARRDAGRDLAWPGSGFSLAPRPRERGGWQNRRGNIGRCLRQATLGRREFFARPQLNPTELRVACRRATMSRRAYAAAAAARPLCRRRSSQRLACFHRRSYGAAAAWSGGTARRWPGLGLAGGTLVSASHFDFAGAALLPAAQLALVARALCSAACWTRQRLGRFAGGTLVLASLFNCAGAAPLPAAQLGSAGLSAQARLRRQLLLEGGGDMTRCRPGVSPAAGDIGSEPEPEPWSAVAAACPIARLARAAGGSGALVARALRSAACWTRRSLGRLVGVHYLPRRASTTALTWHAERGAARIAALASVGGRSMTCRDGRRRPLGERGLGGP